jgi:spatacsin
VLGLYEDVKTFHLNRQCITGFMAGEADALLMLEGVVTSDPAVIWSVMMDLNEESRLMQQEEIINPENFNGQAVTYERIFNQLHRPGSPFCSQKYLHQVVRTCARRGDDILQASHLLPSLIQFCSEEQLHEFGLWLSLAAAAAHQPHDLTLPYKLFRRSAHTHLSPAELIAHLMGQVCGGSEEWTAAPIQDKCSSGLLVACLFSCSSPAPAPDQLISMSEEVAKKSFPLIARSIKVSLSLVPRICDEQPFSSPYYLMRRTSSLDLTSLFLWQENNLFKTRHSDLPTFSRHNIHNFTGLDTQINCLYYICEGRPMGGFRKITHAAEPQLVTQVTHAACDASKKLEVLSSAVIFHEFWDQNSWRLRLHLSIGHCITRYAADFLGLRIRQQEQELGHLLRQAIDNREGQAVIKLLQLLLTAFERKFHEERKTSPEECFEWSIVTSFCRQHSLDLPFDFLTKCAANDDWLLFVVFIQLYDYPKHPVLSILPSFNNGCIADHLEKAFLSSATATDRDENPVSILKGAQKPRDSHASRNSLYSRIGVHKAVVTSEARKLSPKYSSSIPDDDMRSVFSEADVSTTTDTMSVLSRDSSEAYDSDKPFDWVHPPADIYNLILHAQRKGDSALPVNLLLSGPHLKNHVVVLLAASLTSDSNRFTKFDILCFWLTAAFRSDLPDGVADRAWDTSSLVTILRGSLSHHMNLKVLRLGMTLFEFEDNPLSFLSQFLIEFLLEKKYQKSIELLMKFQESFWKQVPSDGSNPMEGNDSLSAISVAVICACLSSITNTYELKLLLRHLDFARVQNMFPACVQVPNFNKLSRMTQCLNDIDFSVPISKLLWISESSSEFADVIIGITESLQFQSHFAEALQIATVTGVNTDTIIISECRIKCKNSKESFSFWEECFNLFNKHSIPAPVVIHFLQTAIPEINSKKTKTFVLIEVYRLSLTSGESESVGDILTQLFLNLIEDEMHHQNEDAETEKIWDLLSKNLVYDTKCNPICDTNVDAAVLDQMIGKLVTISLDVAKMFAHLFNYQSRELTILTICRSLVSSKTLTDVEADYIRQIRPDVPVRGGNMDIDEILSVLESLSLHLQHCSSFCRREILIFRTSVALSRTFDEVNGEDSTQNLRSLIFCTTDSMTLAKEFISMFNIDDNVVALILYNDLVSCVKSVESMRDNVSVESSASGMDGNSGFLSNLRLMSDPSVLGRLILFHLKAGVLDEYSLPVVAEFYIRAHDCFSFCCDIEGISLVLRNVKFLVMQQLAPACDYSSMIRVLTGIGRYSEMTYIFDILKEHHKFELLLGKRIEKVPQLRVALLDSLKGDKEMYPLVALNFSMHREIAEMLEADAIRAIRGVGSLRKFSNANTIRDILERSLADFVDASESFSKANCFNHAKKCANYADLVALQIHFLSSGTDLLNMNATSAAEFVINHTNCAEAMIVAESYNQHRCWAAALYNQTVLRGDNTYLREYQLLAGPISSTLLEDIVSRAQQENVLLPGSNAEANVNRLIAGCRDVEVVQRISRRTGYRVSGIDGEDWAYVNDLVRSSS